MKIFNDLTVFNFEITPSINCQPSNLTLEFLMKHYKLRIPTHSKAIYNKYCAYESESTCWTSCRPL